MDRVQYRVSTPVVLEVHGCKGCGAVYCARYGWVLRLQLSVVPVLLPLGRELLLRLFSWCEGVKEAWEVWRESEKNSGV